MTVKGIRAILIAAFAVILLMFIAAPLAIPHGTVDGLEGGHPVEPDFFEIWETMDPIPAAVYAVGDVLCHQDSERSFHLNGSQLPICVRDVSALAGLIAGLALCIFFGDVLRRYAYPMLIASFALMIADLIIQGASDLNVFATRIVTGAFCGLAVASVIDRWMANV